MIQPQPQISFLGCDARKFHNKLEKIIQKNYSISVCAKTDFHYILPPNKIYFINLSANSESKKSIN